MTFLGLSNCVDVELSREASCPVAYVSFQSLEPVSVTLRARVPVPVPLSGSPGASLEGSNGR